MGSRNVEQVLPSNWLHMSTGVVAASPDLACLPHPMVGSIVPSKPACTKHSACSKDAFRAEHCPLITMPDAIDSRRNRIAWTEHPRNCNVQRPTQRNSRECDWLIQTDANSNPFLGKPMPRLYLRLSIRRICSITPSTKRPVWPPSSYGGGNSFQSIASFSHETFASARSGNPVWVVSKSCFPTCSHSIEVGPCRSRTTGIPHPIHVDLCPSHACNGDTRFGGSPTNTTPKIGEPVESFASRKRPVG